MNIWGKVVLLFILVPLIFLFTQFQPQLEKTIQPNAPAIAIAPPTLVVSQNNSKCHINGVFPDPICTPGSIDLRVTQDTIQQTICVKGYSTTVRPSTSYTNKLKTQQITEYGYSDTNRSDYEEDHLISLELGGNPTDPKNLWPEPDASPNPKDKIENLCHKKVCSGEITLAQAQKEIATNWQTACQ